MHRLLLTGALLAACTAAPAFAADSPTSQAPAAPAAAVSNEIAPVQVPRVDTDIVVDGVLDDAAWAQAAPVELSFEVHPADNAPAPVRTLARIAHTDDAVLVSFRVEDPDPAQVRAKLRDRDSISSSSDDYVGIMVDTFDDQRRAYEFFVNPLGVQADFVREEANGNEDASWDGLWTSAARMTAHGYDVEMRIPFSTLRFTDTDGPRRWAASFWRNRPRDQRNQYANHRNVRGSRCFQCQFPKLEGFAGVRQGRNLEITPTLTVINAEERVAPGAPWVGAGTDFEPGLDVAWAPSPNLTLNGTLNPDFSQVESDQAQLDLNTSFALFFPEKRPFFLEGADYFSTPLQVLYTRQIADPDAGLRVTGRNGRQAYGAILARDATTQILVPGVLGSGFRFLDQEADVLVGRYRFDLTKGASLGAITTLRRGDGYENAVAGVDGRWQEGIHTVRGQWLSSDSQYPGGLGLADTAPAGDALFLHYNVGKRNWFANVQHMDVDPGFRSDLGFITQVGYDKQVAGGGYTWFGADGARITRGQVNGDWDITHRCDGQLLEREVEAYAMVHGPRQSMLQVGGLTRDRFWQRAVDPVGMMFAERFFTIYGEATLLPGLSTGMFYRNGDQLDLAAARMGRGPIWEPWMNLDLGRGININLNGSWQRLDRDGGTAFDARVADARLSWQLDPHQRLRLSVQASEVERNQALYAQPVATRARDVAAQLLYSYKVNPRTALYAGYSHGAFADERIDTPDPSGLFDSSRSVFLKLSYAWQPSF